MLKESSDTHILVDIFAVFRLPITNSLCEDLSAIYVKSDMLHCIQYLLPNL